MQHLINSAREAMAAEEEKIREIRRRDLLSDALRELKQHETGLLKAYPMALLEVFAEGATATPRTASPPSAAVDTGLDFGELSLLDDAEVDNQLELARAQQIAIHKTEAVLAELNTLVSAAQGLHNVQPERNPLRPESYIRALQRAVNETGAPAPVRQVWMEPMRELLGASLVAEYERAVKYLRQHGVVPVGYAVAGAMGAGPRTAQGAAAATGIGYAGSQWGAGGSGYGAAPGDYAHSGHSRPASGFGGWAEPGYPNSQYGMAPAVEEALLTVEILRNMLLAGDPFAQGYGGVPTGPMVPMVSQPIPMHSHIPSHLPPDAAVEALEDMAQLERLVGRLSGQSGQVPMVGAQAAPVMMVPMSAPVVQWVPAGIKVDSPGVALEVVARMMDNINRDPRLLQPVQQLVRALEPALKQLVQHDLKFFTDAQHPARRMLDELTQRSLAFQNEASPGFVRFVRLLERGVEHINRRPVKDAAPFDTVLKALQSAWDAPPPERKAPPAPAANAAPSAPPATPPELRLTRQQALAEQIGASIRQLPDVEGVPREVLDFAAGPWAEVIATSQVQHAQDPEAAEDGDPGGYLALIPLLFWSAQPALTRADPDRLTQAIPGLLSALREGLKSIDYPATQTSAFMQRLAGLHQRAFEKPEPLPEPSPQATAEAPPTVQADTTAQDTVVAQEALPAASNAPDPYAAYTTGAWVELASNGHIVRTQLTWCSPHGTLFLFTAPDGSTQSMTRRMRNKLLAEGALRLVPPPAPPNTVPATIPGALGQTGLKTAAAGKTTSKRKGS
jgi:hypothetical protein